MDNARAELQGAIEAFFLAWASNDWSAMATLIGSGTVLLSGQHGDAKGFEGIATALGTDTSPLPLHIRTSNHYIGALGSKAMASAYAVGRRAGLQVPFLFGATVVFECSKVGDVWSFTEIRVSVNWYRGSSRDVQHWKHVPDGAGWKLGDAPPTLVSELDSPWARLPHSELPLSAEQGLRELYSKYSFAIDQGDIALLADSFAINVRGGFAPMGQLKGRHAVIGQLKSFRRHWPWMQHFADVLLVEVDPGERRGRMIVARIIPERQDEPGIGPVYGAHYQIEAALETDGKWRIQWTDYRPGWFAPTQLPGFEIGTSEA